jgi:hypothetical protein
MLARSANHHHQRLTTELPRPTPTTHQATPLPHPLIIPRANHLKDTQSKDITLNNPSPSKLSRYGQSNHTEHLHRLLGNQLQLQLRL